MKNKITKIIVLGPQSSGKGTQAEFLSSKLDVPAISMGQVLRDEIEQGTNIGKKVEATMNRGELVLNSVSNSLIHKRLKQEDCQAGFVLDGFPRSLFQAEFLNTIIKIDKVILINVSDAEAKYRMSGRRVCEKCGANYHVKYKPSKKEGRCDECGGKLKIRDDDTPQAIEQRLKIYHTETNEVIEYYRQKGLLVEINGEQPIEAVKQETFDKLNLN